MTALTVIRLVLLFDAAGWAMVLAQPGRTFSISAAYSGMATIADERIWAMLFVGFAGALAVTWQKRWGRVAVTFLLAVLHAWIGLSIGRSSAWLSTGVVAQIGLLGQAWWLLGEDVRRAVHD